MLRSEPLDASQVGKELGRIETAAQVPFSPL